jgi:hypothetical protein
MAAGGDEGSLQVRPRLDQAQQGFLHRAQQLEVPGDREPRASKLLVVEVVVQLPRARLNSAAISLLIASC